MVALPRAVDVEKEAGQGGKTFLVDDGRYQAVFIKSELKDSKKGGKYVEMSGRITSGQYMDLEFIERLNIINSSEVAVQIAMKTIANIGKAVGLPNVTDTAQLHNKPLIIETKQKKKDAWTNDDDEVVEGGYESEIKKYLPITSTTAMPTQPATPVENVPNHPVQTQGDVIPAPQVDPQAQAQATQPAQQTAPATGVEAPAVNPFAAPTA